jgi:hypothetical protein
LDLDLSAIGGANDTTIPIAKGKGGAAANDEAPEARNYGEGGELGGGDSDCDGQRSAGDHDSSDSDVARDLTNPLPDHVGDDSGNEGDHDPGDAGAEGTVEGEAGFVWTKKARRADEKRREEESAARIATKAARKTQALEARMRQEEAEQREASALRKRRRPEAPRNVAAANPEQPKTKAKSGGRGVIATRPVNLPALPSPRFLQQQPRSSRKEQARAAAKAGKRASRLTRSEGTPKDEHREENPTREAEGGGETSREPSESEQLSSEGDGRDAGESASGERQIRQRLDTDAAAGKPSCRETRSLDRSVRKNKRALEFEKHKRKTKSRERGRHSARELVKEALRQSRGDMLDSNEQQLATYAANLSPAKILGAGIRIGAMASSGGSDGSESAAASVYLSLKCMMRNKQ